MADGRKPHLVIETAKLEGHRPVSALLLIGLGTLFKPMSGSAPCAMLPWLVDSTKIVQLRPLGWVI